MNNMDSSIRGIFLLLLLVVSLFTFFSLNYIKAQQDVVDAKSIGLEETTIIEFENKGNVEIKTFRIWLGQDDSFKSFKTEKGWTGEKTPQGVIIFSTSEPIKPGQSVKFGVKTDKSEPGINWRAIDKNNNELQIGKTLVTESPSKPTAIGNKLATSGDGGILSSSTFRLIPEKPHVGATVRVTGEQFSPNHEFDLYVDNTFMKAFKTNEDGRFMFTTKLPETQKADRVNFLVKDKQGNEKVLSIRLGSDEPRMGQDEVRLTILGLPSIISPGDELLISGTANPGGTVTANIKNPDGSVVTTEAIQVDTQGKWSFQTIVALDTPLGKYTAEITDGKTSIEKSWTVESSKTIQIIPSKIKYDPGEILSFNGTGLPNQEIEIVLKNPNGAEIFSDILQPRSDGFFNFEFPTDQATLQGTYSVIAFQGEQSEIIQVGLGEPPKAQLVIKMDKLNYKAGSTAIISISGEASSTVALLIIDPSDKPKFSDTVTLGPDGKKDYELNLTNYGSGVYTTVITRGNSQSETVFSVGLQTGSGEINVGVTKTEFKPGDSVLVLGDSGSNILLTITLYDPDGKEVKRKETFTNKNGRFSDGTFRIPSDAKIGTWKIKAVSGPNFDEQEFAVVPSKNEGMSVEVFKVEQLGQDKILTIRGFGGPVSQIVVIEIFSSDSELIQSLNNVFTTKEGSFLVVWKVPKDTFPGIITIKASYHADTAENTFELK